MALKAMGYSCNLDPGRKYWTIRQQDWQRPIRMYRMGDAYTNESIISRLEREAESKMFSSFQRIIVVRKRQYWLQTRGDRIRKVGGSRVCISITAIFWGICQDIRRDWLRYLRCFVTILSRWTG